MRKAVLVGLMVTGLCFGGYATPKATSKGGAGIGKEVRTEAHSQKMEPDKGLGEKVREQARDKERIMEHKEEMKGVSDVTGNATEVKGKAKGKIKKKVGNFTANETIKMGR